MKLKIIISGSGGQGIQFAAMLLAKSAIHQNYFVTMIKSYGPESRGGSSAAQVTISDKYIVNPVISKADYLLSFTDEANMCWKDKSENVIFIKDADNMFALGLLSAHIGFDIEKVISTMKEITTHTERIDTNEKNLREGYNSHENDK